MPGQRLPTGMARGIHATTGQRVEPSPKVKLRAASLLEALGELHLPTEGPLEERHGDGERYLEYSRVPWLAGSTTSALSKGPT